MRKWCFRTIWIALVVCVCAAPASADAVVAQPPVDEMYGSVEIPPVAVVPAVVPMTPAAIVEDPSGPSPAAVLASMGYRSEIERTWFESGAASGSRGTKTRYRALELGADNLDAAARALIASGTESQALTNRLLAVRLAPDLPLAHIALAHEQWRAGEYRAALDRMARSVLAIPRNLEASIWLVGSLLVMFGTVLIAASLVFMLVVGASVFTHAAHDLGDVISTRMPAFGRTALLASITLAPLAIGEGALGVVLVIFAVSCVYGGPRHRLVLVLSGMLLVLGVFPVMRSAGQVLTALEADPVASATLAVVRGTATDSQVELLREADLHGDELAKRILAVRARRVGDVDEAQERMLQLVQSKPDDVLALTGLGNIAFDSGRNEEAIGYYELAAAQDSNAILMFNLSQAYAKAFRMEEFEHSLARAQELDPELIGELSRIGDTEFVADIPFSILSIRARMISAADGDALSSSITRVLAPGWLGQSWMHVGGGFLLVALLSALFSGRYQHASLCSRCGRRICARCDDSMWSNELCDGCHHLFNRPQGTDPALRMARVQALRVRESRMDNVRTAVSLLIPGASGLLARRPDLCFMGLIFFAWALVLVLWRDGVVPDPLSVGGAGSIAFVAAGVVMGLLYLAVMLTGLLIRRSL
ncbi:MAG: tetratricopeptide repeat protein [Deltaproteobacteria bacterium]|nr:tetratricopeptide repeat protein [Deltaproteobacteria bacterium]